MRPVNRVHDGENALGVRVTSREEANSRRRSAQTLRMSFVFAYAMLACIVLPLAAQRYLDAIFLVVSGALMLLGVLVSTRRRDGYNGSASAANVRAPGVLHFLITGLVVLSVTTSDYPWVYTLTTYAFLLAATFNFDRADSIDSSWSRRPLPRVALSLIHI